MTSTQNKLEDGTIELTITIPWADVEKKYQEMVEKTLSEIELPGFRKGKAPRKLALEKIDKTKVYEEVLKLIIPNAYNEALTAQKVKPVVSPKIELKEATENKDWVIRALTCERPVLELGEYKKKITDLNNAKKNKIWVPGDDKNPSQATGAGNREPAAAKKPTLDEILKTVYESVKINIPALLTEHEVNRSLSELLDETKKLGLTVDQYLASTGRTADGVRHEYEEQAKRTLTLEFALEEIADKEGVLVSDDDIDTVIKSAKTDQERDALSKERYYLASVLRRQKTLDFLGNLY